MFNNSWKKLSCIAGIVLVAFWVSSVTASASEKSSGNIHPKKRVAVIPFEPLTPENESARTVFCPLCGIGVSGGHVSKGSEKIVEDVFINKLRESKDIEFIPSDKVEVVYKGVFAETLKESMLKRLRKIGSELGADFVAVGYVFRYIDRVGYEYSIDRPASVGFEIHLIKTADGSMIWRGSFDKTQKSLMEDVSQLFTFLKNGGKWLTARQLTEQGMNEILKTFPNFE